MDIALYMNNRAKLGSSLALAKCSNKARELNEDFVSHLDIIEKSLSDDSKFHELKKDLVVSLASLNYKTRSSQKRASQMLEILSDSYDRMFEEQFDFAQAIDSHLKPLQNDVNDIQSLINKINGLILEIEERNFLSKENRMHFSEIEEIFKEIEKSSRTFCEVANSL